MKSIVALALLFSLRANGGEAPAPPPAPAVAPAPGVTGAPAASAAPQKPAADDQWETRVVGVEGDVYIIPAAHPDSFYEAQVNAPVANGDTIQTGESGGCDLALEKDNLLHIENGTVFNVADLNRDHASFNITFGGVLGKLAGVAERGASMEFHTPTGWGGIRGTEIGISATGDKTQFAVFGEGHFAVHQGEGEVMLGAHQELGLAHGAPLAQPHELRFFEKKESRMITVLQRRDAVSRQWKPASAAAQMEHRNALLAKPVAPERAARRIEKGREARVREVAKVEKRAEKLEKRAVRTERRANSTQPNVVPGKPAEHKPGQEKPAQQPATRPQPNRDTQRRTETHRTEPRRESPRPTQRWSGPRVPGRRH